MAELPPLQLPVPSPDPNSNPNTDLIPTSNRGDAALPPAEPENLHPYRFQRTDQWKPVYKWLENLDTVEVVTAKDISDWLAANPDAQARLFARHSKYHMTHYIQRLHLKLLKRRGKIPKNSHFSAKKAIVNTYTSRAMMTTQSLHPPGKLAKDDESFIRKRTEASLRYELLTDLQRQLTSALSKQKHLPSLPKYQSQSIQRLENVACESSHKAVKDDSTKSLSLKMSSSQNVVSMENDELAKSTAVADITLGQKQRRKADMLPAWSTSEAFSGVTPSKTSTPSSPHHKERSNTIQEVGEPSSTLHKCPSRKNIIIFLQGRERGSSWPVACSAHCYAGRQKEKWIPFFEGWRSLGGPFEGPASWLERRSYSSWIPTWCAYASSVPAAHPQDRHSEQRVLNARFHPEGLPQLVCSTNEAPNELLLYNLLSGRAVQLKGHNCKIQAVDFAVRGASVVSCGANLLKIWDCITGSCLFTLGAAVADGSSAGHSKKISAMTVNNWQSCLVATSGGVGDEKLLLWNALRGELSSDLNMNLRCKHSQIPCINTLEFCTENLLLCGSDCSHGRAAVVQLWDIESPQSSQSFPASDSYITSIKSICNTIVTGSGDGTVGLFDLRTCELISYLSVGRSYEVTKVSASSCGTYFAASSTSNCTLVWDVRLIPTNCNQLPLESHRNRTSLFYRPLHSLSHGNQMPTAEHAGQLPGHVEGNEGVNDACWLQGEPILATVSGNGSIAMWDVTLGQPCIRHMASHSRSVNTVAVSPDDEYLCSGGDDQKIVLYHNSRGRMNSNWRLSHPLTE